MYICFCTKSIFIVVVAIQNVLGYDYTKLNYLKGLCSYLRCYISTIPKRWEYLLCSTLYHNMTILCMYFFKLWLIITLTCSLLLNRNFMVFIANLIAFHDVTRVKVLWPFFVFFICVETYHALRSQKWCLNLLERSYFRQFYYGLKY